MTGAPGGRRRTPSAPVVAHIVVALSLTFTTAAVAQEACIPGVTCNTATPAPTTAPRTPTPKPLPTPTKPPASPAVEEPTLKENVSKPTLVPPAVLPAPTTAPTGSTRPTIPPGFQLPVFPRTPGRNTSELVALLKPLAKGGISLEQVLVAGMGRFPVAGLAYYSDDWLNPRFTPSFHLHHGLDIFADFGSPVRVPDKGIVTALTTGATGGIGVWTRGSDGTHYYFAHLQARVKGIHVGQRLRVGQVIGFVGDTGNARGGAPHLHFEVHRPDAIPPKPSVDRWLDEAVKRAPAWIAAQRKRLETDKDLFRQKDPYSMGPTSDLETTMVLSVLDPVGGAVGLLPRVDLAPQQAPVSTHVIDELIRLRLDGYLLAPGEAPVQVRD